MMIKAVMVDGPKSGEVVSTSAEFGAYFCFAIPAKLVPFALMPDYDQSEPTWHTATYRRAGRVIDRGQIIDVYVFDGMS